MAGAFRIAEGYVEVTADESGYDRAMQRLRQSKNKVKVGIDVDDRAAVAKLDRLVRDRLLNVKLKVDSTALDRLKLRDAEVTVSPKMSDAAFNRVKSQLDRLTADRTVRILATADTRVAADEIRNLTQRRRVRIGIDVDTRVAADDIANLTRRRTVRVTADRVVNIRASVDTRVAAQEIRNLIQRRQVRIGVDVDTRVAADDIANLTRRRTMTVQARADTSDAANSLRFLTRDRTVNVRARMLGGLGGLAEGGEGGECADRGRGEHRDTRRQYPDAACGSAG